LQKETTTETPNPSTPKNEQTFDKNYYKGLIEAILFIEVDTVNISKLSNQLEIDIKQARTLIKELKEEYENRGSGLQLNELATGIRLSTNKAYGSFLRQYYKAKHQKKFSRISLETLAIISYKQPITRAEIEDIRGVSSDNSIRDLLEKKLIKIIGRRKVPGNPMEYGTTKEFLEYFGLTALKEMPTLKEIKELKFE
jgi:segregation and condensation protein B